MNISHRIGIVAAGTAALLFSGSASAQSAAGEVFLQLFNVGSPEQSLGIAEEDNFAGTIGNRGCSSPDAAEGRSDGAALSLFLKDFGGESSDLFLFCDSFTGQGEATEFGWNSENADDLPGAEAAVRRMQEGAAPAETFEQTSQAESVAGLQVTNISQRIAQLHVTRRGMKDVSGYAFERGRDVPNTFDGAFGLREPTQGNAGQVFARAMQRGFSSGDGLLGIDGLAAFINGQYTRIDDDGSDFETGSETNGGGVTIGIDKQLGENAFLGLAFGYSRLWTDFDHDFGESELDDFSVSLYGSAFLAEKIYIDGIVTGSILRFDQEREIPSAIPSVTFSTIKSEPDGWNITADVGLGGEFSLEPFELNPYVRVALSHTDIDAFKESGSTMALTVDDQDSTSITSTIGLSVALPISTGFGVVSPYLRGEYLHEYQDQGTEITGNLRVNPLESFRLRPNSIDRNYFGAGGGMTLALGEGISAFVDYHIVLGYQDLVAQQATLGGRLEF